MSPPLTGAVGFGLTVIVIFSLQVKPSVVTSTQYSVVSVGETEMVLETLQLLVNCVDNSA